MRLVAFIGACVLFLLAFLQGEADSRGWFTIKEVQVKGDLQYIKQNDVDDAYRDLIGKSLLLTPLNQLLDIANSPEWVEFTKVRKLWPNKVLVEIHEHAPLAYWGSRQMITTSGELISITSPVALELPKLIGPEGTDRIVVEQFHLVSQALSVVDLPIQTLVLEDRGAWNLYFENGLLVKLGRDEILERLQRFIAVYKSDLSGRIKEVGIVDARYSHGVAVTWNKVEN